MEEKIAVIDTETTWSNHLMTIGITIADASDFQCIAYKYWIVHETMREGGMYADRIHMRDLEETVLFYEDIKESVRNFLDFYHIRNIFAYNAKFDYSFLPFLQSYHWHDIMRLAAYRQTNPCIPYDAECCKSGRLKRGYGVENILKMLGKRGYEETHNALFDSMDELEIMRLLEHPVEDYPLLFEDSSFCVK